MNEERLQELRDILMKMTQEERPEWEILAVRNAFVAKHGDVPGKADSTSEATAMGDTLTGDVEADVLSSGANIAHPDFWEAQETNSNDWVKTASGGYRNEVTGDIMESGVAASAFWNEEQAALWNELQLNEKLKENIVSNTEVDNEQDAIDTYWDSHSPNKEDIAAKDVIRKSDYNVSTLNGKQTVTFKGSVVKEDDPIHGETVKILKREATLNKNKEDKKKKEDKDEALESLPTVSSVVDEWDNKTVAEKGELYAQRNWFNDFKTEASKHGFIIDGTYSHSDPAKTNFKITHVATGESIEGKFFLKGNRAKADEFMRRLVEGKQSVVRTLMDSAEAELEGTADERATKARDEVNRYVQLDDLVDDGLKAIDSMSSEEVAEEEKSLQQSQQKAVEAYNKFLTSPVKKRVQGSRGFGDRSGDERVRALGFDPRYYILANEEELGRKKEQYDRFIANGSKIEDVPGEYVHKERFYHNEVLPGDSYGPELERWARDTYFAIQPNAMKEFLKMTDSQVEKFLLEKYKKDYLGEYKATGYNVEKETQHTFEHIKGAKLHVAVEKYIQQAGITDRKEIEAIYHTVFADHFKLENLDQFNKNVDTEDGFTTVALDTIYSDVDPKNADVLSRATNSLHSAKDREALVKNVEAQVRKMDFSTWTKGSVQEAVGEEIDIDLSKFTAKEAELVEKNKIVNDKYADNREQLEANINAREEVVASLNKITGDEYKTQEELDKAQKKLDVLKTEYNELTSEIQKGLNTNTLLFGAASKMDEEFKEVGLELDDVELWSKYINQNFAPGTRMLWNAVSATADMVESGVEFIGMLGDANDEAQSWVLKGLGVGDEAVEAWCAINDYIPGFGAGVSIPKSSRDQFHSWVDNWQEGVESGLGRSVAFDDINGIGDFGNWFGAMFASQIPNLALMASTGGASLYVMGATAAGGKYKDLREQDELYESSGGLYGNDYTFNQMFSTSILTGAAEALSETITLGQMKMAKGMWKGMTKEGLQKALKPGFGDFLLKNVVSKRGLKKGFIDTMEEGGSEVVATMAENWTSRHILGNKDVHLLDGGLESFVSGALISRMIGTFGIAGQAVSTFADPSVQGEKNAYIERQRSIMYSLSGRMGGGDSLISTGRPGGGGENVEISREEREELELELAENQIKLDELVELDIQRVDMMEDADKAEMIKLEKQQVRDALEWETADDARREELLDKLERRTKVKQEIIDKYPPEETKAAYAESMERARAKVALAKKAGKEIEIEEGGKERAVEWIKEMEALGMQVDTSEGIDGSFYGATAEIKTKDEAGKEITKTVIFVNKETILKDGMVQTAAHEFMHATLYNTVMQDPGVREVLGGELSKILKGKGVKISEKARFDLQRLNGYSAQEIGEELFAIVAEHMVSGDITIDDNTAGKFKDMIRRIWQNIFGYDINFDTTDDVREFMKNYARNIKGVGRPDNKINAAIEGMLTKAVGGKLVEKGKALKPNQRSKEKMKVDFSKARDNHIDLNPEQARQNKKNFDKLTQNEDGTKKWSSKEEWDSSAEKWEAFSLIDNSNTFVDNLIMSGMVFGEGYIRSEQDKKDFIKQVKEHLQDRLVGGMKKTATKQIDAIKDKQQSGEITAKETAEQIEKVENNRDNYRRGFDPTEANGSLFGWMTGGSGNALESTMYRARGDVMNEWKRDPNRNILSLDAPIGEGGETFGSRLEGKADPSAGVDTGSQIDPDDLTKVWEDLEFNPETVASIQTSISRSNIDISDTSGFAGAKRETVGVDNIPILKNGKPVLNKKGKPKTKTPSKVSDVKFSGRASGVLKAVASEFGVDHRKVPTGITLLPKERAAILDRILANPIAILNNMPDQHTRSGKAVGVQSVLLNALFEEAGYRGSSKAATAMGDVGMDPQGIGIWNKKDGLNEVMLMEALGVEGAIQNGQFVETGRFDPKSTKFDSILKAVVSQTAALASNQQLRVQAIENKSHPTDVIAEFGDGKNQLSFSKKAPVKFKGDPALIHGLVEFMRDNPNLKLNPKQAAIAYAGQLGLSATSGLANAAEVIQDAIDNPEFDYFKDATLLVEALGKGMRTLDAVYAKGWSDWLTKLGFPENFLFDKTNVNDRADYHVQTIKWLQTLPTAALDNQMAVKMILQNGTKGDFYRNAGEVDAIIKAEKKRRKNLGKKFVEPKTNINWGKVKFDSNLMKKLENVTDKHADVKDREKRVKLITRDAKAVIAKSTSNPVENNKALDEVMEGFNAFVNEKGITEVEKTQRQRFVATTLQDQTSRTAGLIRGAAAFNAISMTPGKLHYKTVSSKKRRALARKLGIIDSSNKIDDSDGDGKKIGSIIAGADSRLSIKEKERLQRKVNKALKEFARENGIKVEEAQQQLFDEVNEIKTRHGEHDVALMLFTTTVFESMTKDTFKDKYPIARKFYSQTALNEDLRVEVDKAWGKTGNAPGWYMGMPGYLRYVVQNPEVARDIIDLEAETTLDKVIAADIALNNLASKYAPITEKARDILGKKGFEADWQNVGYNMIQFLQAERKEAPVESRFLHDKNIEEIKEALDIVKEISYFTENELINNIRGDLTWEKMGRAMIKFLKTERKEAPVESRFLHDKNIAIIKKAMEIPKEISYFTEKKFNNFPKKSKDVISKLPEILKNADTRIAFNELIAEIAKSVYNGTDLVNAEALAINLVRQLDDIKNINNIRKFIAKNSKLVSPDMSLKEMREVGKTLERTISFSRKGTEGSKGITVLDFDDTLATTKSGVGARIPNPDGTPKPGRKVIFMAGGAGSGKGNVISKLGLNEAGYKTVNSDISLEWLKKNHGLPENQTDYTAEQRSQLSKLTWEARRIAKRKQSKFAGKGDGIVVDGTGGSVKVMQAQVQAFKDKGYDVSMVFVETSLEVAKQRNADRKERSLKEFILIKNHEQVQGNKKAFKELFGETFNEISTDNIGLKDALPKEFKDKVDSFTNSYENRRLDAEEFAREGAEIKEIGGEFDFSEFDVVKEGKPGPLFDRAMELSGKFGTDNMFILTARSPESAEAIKEFLDAQGLKIPLKNITGLGQSEASAKANWIAEKIGEGYNDFYFADDAMQNVKAVKDMLDQFDVKGKVQQAKVSFSKKAPKRMSDIIDSSIAGEAIYAPGVEIKAAIAGIYPDGYSKISFSKRHRGEYENRLLDKNPNIKTAKEAKKHVDELFKWLDSPSFHLDAESPIYAAKHKSKFEKLALHYMVHNKLRLPEDGYKVIEAEKLAKAKKIDPFSFKNPNDIIERYAGEVTKKNTDPDQHLKENDNIGAFSNKRELENGITIYDVRNGYPGMFAVRNMVNGHFGKKSNPWCIIQAVNGEVTPIGKSYWDQYGTKQIIFKDGKLIGMRTESLETALTDAGDIEFWSRDNVKYNEIPGNNWVDSQGRTMYGSFDAETGKKLETVYGATKGSIESGKVEVWSTYIPWTPGKLAGLQAEAMVKRGEIKPALYLESVERYKDGKLHGNSELHTNPNTAEFHASSIVQLKEFKNGEYVGARVDEGDGRGLLPMQYADRAPGEAGPNEMQFSKRVNASKANVEDITGWTTSKNKAILVVGGAGSGKSTLISSLVKRSKGFTAVEADAMVEAAASKKGLNLDYGKMSDAQLREVNALYVKSNKVVKKARLQSIKQNKGVIIEVGTSDSGVVLRESDKLKDNGYEVKLVVVDTKLETAIERNKSRSRTLEDTDVEHTFNILDDNIKALRTKFGADIIEFNDGFADVGPNEIMFSRRGESSDLNLDIILEETKGVDRNKKFSAAKARKRGKNKGRFKFFIPPSADDFAGLMYAFMGKGKQGEQHHEFFKKNLFDPFSKGIRQLNRIRQSVANDLKQLRKAMPDVKKKLSKKIPGTEYIYEDAVRVYNWDKAGFDIPGLSETDKQTLVNVVENDASLNAFAQGVNSISNTPGGMVKPGNDWLGGTINSDVNEVLENTRAAHLQQWIENKNVIFSEANLNKIEAVYGAKFREALEDSLWRMEHGGTRSRGKDRLLNNWMTWIHGSVGATMFFNARSAVLQQLSNVNFLNWNDNNPIKAAKAFANQKQYWTDFAMIFNSPWLKQRRSGIATDVNATELLNAMKDSKNPMKTAIAYLLRLGFTPTQIGDSLAIATGGSTMYRNRIDTYMDQGMSKAEAEVKAFEDMMEVAEETQQSTREDKISQQQASPLGKFILAFQNTPMQYNRIMKKAALDLVNGRGDPKANISKIVYYGAIQNMIFYGLQQALFAAMFSDDEEDQLTEGKKVKLANGMLDSVLRGSGMHGAVIATVKNVIMKFMKEKEKMDDDKFFTDPDWANVLVEGLNVSPPIGIKARKIHSALKTWEYNDDIIRHMDKTDIDNPMWEGIFNVTEAVTNAPLHRVYNKTMNIRESLDADNEAWKRIAMFMGWSRWSFGIENQDVVTAKGEVKEIKAVEAEERREMKKRAKDAERQAADEAIIESNLLEQDEEREEGQEDIKCAAVSRSGNRCGNKVKGGGNFCTIHEDAPQRANGEKTQCSHVKGDGNRCKMKTTNKSGKCYYHD
jgi:predicted ATPase/shikimate kinase